MIEIRKSDERGIAEHGWLSSRHSFSFAQYYDPRHMGFGPLRVINEDRVHPGHGFGTHGHQNMEIISYVLSGALEHKDSMGSGSVLRYGQVQRMSAGRGVMHSEFNPSASEPVHFLQIWITPDTQNTAPDYDEAFFDTSDKKGQWRLIVSPDGRDGSLRIRQDAWLYASILDTGDALSYTPAPGRCGYLHVARGAVTANDVRLGAGDALQFVNEPRISLVCPANAEILLFDLPATAD